MSHKVNLVRVFTSATGNSTPITLGAAYSQLFMTPAEAGAMDGRVYTYLIVDGNDWEMGRGAYTASGTSLARTTVIASRISGTLGTSRITLSGTAQVRFIEAAEDMDGVRGTRVVTGTSDVLANSDQGYVVTYSNAGAIAVSLAQAGSSNLFLGGWATNVQNLGVGTVTITPATSTINGAATLTLATGMGALIWSDGTNYRAYFIPGSKPLLAANNLSDVNASTARANIGAINVVAGHLFGLTLSTAGSSSTFGISAGEAAASTVDRMVLATAYTKTTSTWAVGSGNGALDTGVIVSGTWYYVYVIKRPDTGVVDVLISTSASSPTLPANYTMYRRIGAMYTDIVGKWVKFVQTGDEFLWDTPSLGVSTSITSTASTASVGVPSISLEALLNASLYNGSSKAYALVYSPLLSTQVAGTPAGNYQLSAQAGAAAATPVRIRTNNATIVYVGGVENTGTTTLSVTVLGWIDRRGRDS